MCLFTEVSLYLWIINIVGIQKIILVLILNILYDFQKQNNNILKKIIPIQLIEQHTKHILE